MHDSTPQTRRLRVMDWLVIALIGFAVAFPFLLTSADMDRRHTLESVATIIAALGCVLLISWMWFADGAHSSVWRWLPPFWPWSRYLTGSVSRWCLVALLVLGTVLANGSVTLPLAIEYAQLAIAELGSLDDMRDVRFKSRPAPAPTAGPWQHAPLDEFALRLSPIGYALTVQRTIPSLDDLNREFMKVINDNGMSGGTEWKPFTITGAEYADLCEAFATHPSFSLRV